MWKVAHLGGGNPDQKSPLPCGKPSIRTALGVNREEISPAIPVSGGMRELHFFATLKPSELRKQKKVPHSSAAFKWAEGAKNLWVSTK